MLKNISHEMISVVKEMCSRTPNIRNVTIFPVSKEEESATHGASIDAIMLPLMIKAERTVESVFGSRVTMSADRISCFIIALIADTNLLDGFSLKSEVERFKYDNYLLDSNIYIAIGGDVDGVKGSLSRMILEHNDFKSA